MDPSDQMQIHEGWALSDTEKSFACGPPLTIMHPELSANYNRFSFGSGICVYEKSLVTASAYRYLR